MYKALAPGCIGHNPPLEEAAAIAQKYGFHSISVDIPRETALRSAVETKAILDRHGLLAEGGGLPVQCLAEEPVFYAGLAKLEAHCRYAQGIGMTYFLTWISPGSDLLTYGESFRLYSDRLARCAEVLRAHDLDLAVEFVGTPSARAPRTHPFVYNLDGLLELFGDIGAPNLGLLLDIWHWEMAGHTMADLARIPSGDFIKLVHINDAPANTPLEAQQDGLRRMPGATGVLHIAAFFEGIQRLGYQGGVLAEPFESRLASLSFEEAVLETRRAIDAVWPG